MRIKREVVRSERGAARVMGALVMRLRAFGRDWLDALKALKNRSVSGFLMTILLGIGLVVTFLALMYAPILGLVVAAGAAIYVYKTRHLYLPLKYDWKKDYDTRGGDLGVDPRKRRTASSVKARRAGASARLAPAFWELCDRVAGVLLMSLGGSVVAAASGVFAGAAVSAVFASLLIVLVGADDGKLKRRR